MMNIQIYIYIYQLYDTYVNKQEPMGIGWYGWVNVNISTCSGDPICASRASVKPPTWQWKSLVD